VFVGGVSNTPGLAEFAREQLQLHTRIGKMQNIGGLADTLSSTEYSTAVGLMMLDGILSLDDIQSVNGSSSESSFGLITKIKKIVKR
jgi:cell division ATPase FtsA